MDEIRLSRLDAQKAVFKMSIQALATARATQALLVNSLVGEDRDRRAELIRALREQANKAIELIAERLYVEYGILPDDIQELLKGPEI